MVFYWRFDDIPELSGLEKSQQTEVWAATAGRRSRKFPRFGNFHATGEAVLGG